MLLRHAMLLGIDFFLPYENLTCKVNYNFKSCIATPVQYHSNLAASAQIKLLLEMLKFLNFNFVNEQNFVKENGE
jgi:hypothetical protein